MAYDRACELLPGVGEVWLNRGVVLGLMGRGWDAVGDFRRAVGIDGGSFKGHFNLGNGLADGGIWRGRWLGAYERAILIRGDFVRGLCNLGKVLMRLAGEARGRGRGGL